MNCTFKLYIKHRIYSQKTTWIAASAFPLWKLYGSCKLLHTLENPNSPSERGCFRLSAHLSDPEAPSQAHKELSWCCFLVLQQLLSEGEMKQNTLSCSLSKIAEITRHLIPPGPGGPIHQTCKTRFWSLTTAFLNKSQWTKVCSILRKIPEPESTERKEGSRNWKQFCKQNWELADFQDFRKV